MPDINPFRLIPAEDQYFVGRDDLLSDWRQRLTAGCEDWKAGKGWLILATGGLGKSSLLARLRKIALEECQAHIVEIDFGLYHDLKNPEGLFEAFESQIANAPDPGTRARKRVGLPPDATLKELLYQYTAQLLKLTGFQINLGPVGFSPSLPEIKLERPEDFALRIGDIFLRLMGIAGRREQPVVVLIDQLGKAHDDVQWANIARLLLGGMLQLRKDGWVNVIFAVAMRPERYALLEAKMQRSDLFGPDLFLRKYLSPFDQEDARQAIRVRAQAHIPVELETGILRAIDLDNEIDPYRLIEAAGAVWAYLYSGEHQRSRVELKPEDIRNILTNYYKEATRFIREADETQWQVLKLLTHYPGGLSISDIAEKLTNVKISGDIQAAVIKLLDQPGYQFIARIEQLNESPRIRLAHELLQEALLHEIPENERLKDQARKTYEDAVWRWKYRHDVLSDRELRTLWENRDLLAWKPSGWEAIAFSIVHEWRPDRYHWLTYRPEAIVRAVEKIVLSESDPSIVTRCYLILTTLHPYEMDRTNAARMGLAFLAKNLQDEHVRLEAALGLARMGELEIARNVLVDLSLNSRDDKIRGGAAVGLMEMGRTNAAREILDDLARYSRDGSARLVAAKVLAGMGELVTSLEVLADLARKSNNFLLYSPAVEILAGMGEAAKAVLVDLALNSKKIGVRRAAAKRLSGLGEDVREVLVYLALNDKDTSLRLVAAEGLARMGEVKIAREVLVKIVRNSRNDSIRNDTAVVLTEIGETTIARKVFDGLARSIKNEHVRLRAAKGLVGLGETEVALVLLTELARSSKNDFVRWETSIILDELGEAKSTLEVLADLACNSDSEDVRQWAAERLATIGEIDLARKVLADLAEHNKKSFVRRVAAKKMMELGEPSYLMSMALDTPLDTELSIHSIFLRYAQKIDAPKP